MEAVKRRHEYVTLEHLLFALLHDGAASKAVRQCGGNVEMLIKELENFFREKMETVPASSDFLPEYTAAFQRVVEYALLQAEGSGQKEVDGGNVLAALFQSPNSHAVYLLKQQSISRLDVLNYLAHGISKIGWRGRTLSPKATLRTRARRAARPARGVHDEPRRARSRRQD